jgi:hypothetical protein
MYVKFWSGNFKEVDGRPRFEWKDNIKMDLQGMRCENHDLIEMPQDKVKWQAFVNTVKNLQVS